MSASIERDMLRDDGGLQGPDAVPGDAGQPIPDVQFDPGAGIFNDRTRGWMSVGIDGVVRGWSIDDDDLSRAVELTILIDEKVAGNVVADEMREELPQENKRHGFNFMAPREYHDSQIHDIRVVVADSGRSLKCKRPEFAITPDGVPSLSVQSVSATGIAGIVSGRAVIWPTLSVFLNGDPTPIAVPAKWSKEAGEILGFTIPDAADVVADWIKADAAIAYAGQDRSYAARLWGLAEIDWRLDGSEIKILIKNLPVVPDLKLVARVWDPTVPAAMAKESPGVRLQRADISSFRFIIPSDLLKAEFQAEIFLELATGERVSLGSWTKVDQESSRIANSGFTLWDGAQPRHWLISGAKVQKGARFDKTGPLIANQQHTIVLAAEGAGRPITLSQAVREEPASSRWTVGVVARSNVPVLAEVRLYGPSDALVANFVARIDVKWKRFDFDLVVPQDSEGPAGLLIDVDAAHVKEGLVVEFDGVDVTANGYQPFADDEPRSTNDSFEGVNLVRNADLTQWPGGLPRPTVGRYEPALGWTVANPGTRMPTTVIVTRLGASDIAVQDSAYGFTLQAPEVTRYCRIEIALDTFPGATSLGLNLSFNAKASPIIEWPMSQLVNPAKWSYINRIFVLHRSPQGGERIICTFKKNILIGPERREYAYFGALNASAESVEFDAIGSEDSALFLCFEFVAALTLSLDNVTLEVAAKAVEASQLSSHQLHFEDESFEGQLRQAKTCEGWLEPLPAQRPHASAVSSTAPAVWNWKWTQAGTVEIVICVYNALEETLQCLRSLIGTTEVPHTVSIINDGSEESCRRALERFVADKPWMRVHTNAVNSGYTRSADIGIRQSEADMVVLLNSDTIVHRGWLESMLVCMQSDPKIGFVGPLSNAATYQSVPETYDLNGKWAINQVPQGMTSTDIAGMVAELSTHDYPRAPLLNGFCTLIKRSVYLEVGGLDIASFPMGYGEENDLCLRVRRAGYDLAIADNVYVYHHKSASFGSERRKELSKIGDTKLKEKHADVNFTESGRRFLEIPTLARMRRELRQKLSDRNGDTLK